MENLIKLLFSPEGRLARLEFFVMGILVSLTFLVVGVVSVALLGDNNAFAPIFLLILMMVFFYIMITFDIKRLHDMGYPGWHMIWIIGIAIVGSLIDEQYEGLAILLGGINLVVNIALTFVPGTKGYNDYGDPRV